MERTESKRDRISIVERALGSVISCKLGISWHRSMDGPLLTHMHAPILILSVHSRTSIAGYTSS